MKTRATNSCLVLVLHRIGEESGASFLKQSQSEKKNPRLLSSILIKSSLINLKLKFNPTDLPSRLTNNI